MSTEIIQGHWVDELRKLPEKIFQATITSPPYFHQRSYLPADHPLKPFELGQEKTVGEYVQNLVTGFREVRRVLRDDGTLWVVIDDKFIKGQPAGAPWRFAFAMQDDGWLLITEILWSKSNPMPQSVQRKPTRSHEYIFLFAKTWDYFYDRHAILTPFAATTVPRQLRGVSENHKHANGAPGQSPHSMSQPRLNVREIYNGEATKDYDSANAQNPSDSKRRIIESLMKNGGANKKTVWNVTKKSFPGNHFATFPPDLVEPMVKAATSEKGCCVVCGSPYRRIIERTGHVNNREPSHVPGCGATKTDSSGWSPLTVNTGEWQASCDCSFGEPVPCRVLDCFGGAATTAIVCEKHKRDCTLIELVPDFISISNERLAAK